MYRWHAEYFDDVESVRCAPRQNHRPSVDHFCAVELFIAYPDHGVIYRFMPLTAVMDARARLTRALKAEGLIG